LELSAGDVMFSVGLHNRIHQFRFAFGKHVSQEHIRLRRFIKNSTKKTFLSFRAGKRRKFAKYLTMYVFFKRRPAKAAPSASCVIRIRRATSTFGHHGRGSRI